MQKDLVSFEWTQKIKIYSNISINHKHNNSPQTSQHDKNSLQNKVAPHPLLWLLEPVHVSSYDTDAVVIAAANVLLLGHTVKILHEDVMTNGLSTTSKTPSDHH